MSERVVRDKSFAFALRVVKLFQHLTAEKKEFVLSKQLLRSGTAIGALVREAEQAESRADFAHKMAIALKEWLNCLDRKRCAWQSKSKSVRSACYRQFHWNRPRSR